ncbi:hypothetical protein AAIB41_02555 [Brucella sp. BE17]|uniref:hypothetical protein n=1 Tax=Brucella sp. BE17 TaxID=3142977 RepID=UPI0031BA641F
MLNPILPTSTGGGTDPELEGRVDALEQKTEQTAHDVTSLYENIIAPLSDSVGEIDTKVYSLENGFDELKTTVEAHENSLADTERFKESATLPFQGFSVSYLYGQAGNFLSWQTPLSRFNTALGTVVFTANDVECSFEVTETDTVNDVVSKFYDAASAAGYYTYPSMFLGNLRFEASLGSSLRFPQTSWPALWSVLGVSGQSVYSNAIEDPFTLSPQKMLLQNSGGENVDDRFQRLQTELDMLDYVSGKVGPVDILQDPQIGQIAYIYSSGEGYYNGAEDLSFYLIASDTMEMTVNGNLITVVAGEDLSFWGIFNAISNSLPHPLMLEYFGGQLRIVVQGNTDIQIISGKIAQLFGFMNSSATTREFEQLPYGFKATEILHDLNRTYPLSVDATLELMRSEIHNLQNGINHLLREVAELKSGGA